MFLGEDHPMTSRQGQLTLAVILCLLFVLAGCTRPNQPGTPAGMGGGLGPHAVFPPVSIVLNYNGGNCLQNGLPAPVGVTKGAAVIWQSSNIAPNHQLAIHFPTGGSPFYEFGSPDGSAVPSGPTSGQVGSTYPYASLTVDNQSCNNAGALGIIMR